MNKHYKRCSVSNMPLKRLRGQSYLVMTKIPRDDDTTKGLHEVARLVYEENLPIYKVITSSVSRSWFKKLKFANVIHHSLNTTLKSEYDSGFQSINDLISKRSETQPLAFFRHLDSKKQQNKYWFIHIC